MSGALLLILFFLQLAAIFALLSLLVAALKQSGLRTLRLAEIAVRPRFHQDFHRPVPTGLGPRFPSRGPPVQPPLYAPDLDRDLS